MTRDTVVAVLKYPVERPPSFERRHMDFVNADPKLAALWSLSNVNFVRKSLVEISRLKLLQRHHP